WAEHVDYFALGTNDLTASALGLDRDDPVAAAQMDSLHPGLLRLLHEAVTQAHRAGRPVTVCGEMAADPQGCLALVALGVDSLSVPVVKLRAVRRALAGLSGARARELAPLLARQRTAAEVRPRPGGGAASAGRAGWARPGRRPARRAFTSPALAGRVGGFVARGAGGSPPGRGSAAAAGSGVLEGTRAEGASGWTGPEPWPRRGAAS